MLVVWEDHNEAWIMTFVIHISILLLLCHLIVAETRVLGIRILSFASTPDSKATLNRQLLIRCDVTAYPPVDVRNNFWLFENDTEQLEPGQKYTFYKEPSHGVVNELKNLLTIHGVTERELGRYTCLAKNSAGMAGNATVTLRKEDSTDIFIDNIDYLKINTDENDLLEANNGTHSDNDVTGKVLTSGATCYKLNPAKTFMLSLFSLLRFRVLLK